MELSNHYISINSRINMITDEIEAGLVTGLDGSVELKKIQKNLDALSEKIQAFIKDNSNALKPELLTVNNQEYKGLLISLCQRETMKYDHIPQWVEAKNTLSKIEKEAKDNYLILKSGKIGAEISGPVGKASITEYFKFETSK